MTKGVVAENIAFSYEQKPVLLPLDVAFPKGKVSVIVGPNGCGKSTLLKVLSGMLVPAQGQVTVDGMAVSALKPKVRARHLSLLPQNNIAPEGITVRELVARGRYPYQSFLRQWSDSDEMAVNEALEQTGLSDLENQPVNRLSGGQRQRAWIGLVLAQQTPIIFLDEPTTFLDIGHQLDVLNVCRRLNQKANTTIIMVLHDLNLAARYADYMVAMNAGERVLAGTPQEVLTTEIIHQLFGIHSYIGDDPFTHTPLVIPASET